MGTSFNSAVRRSLFSLLVLVFVQPWAQVLNGASDLRAGIGCEVTLP
jgi:hypothetical protein